MEVMGLMLGELVDDYTVRVVDVFAMPQSGTGVSVEAVDPVFQTKMMEMLRQTGRYASGSVLLLGFGPDAASDRKQWWDGTTHILALDVGCPRSTSTHNNPSNSLPHAPSPSSSIRYNPSREKW